MTIPIEAAEEIEFARIFERLEKAFNISQAEVARALRVERSYVSMLIKGKRTPHLRTLESMRDLEKKMIAASASEMAAASEGDSELRRLFSQLTELERTDPASFAAAKRVIESLSSVSSKPASAASNLFKKDVASVTNPGTK